MKKKVINILCSSALALLVSAGITRFVFNQTSKPSVKVEAGISNYDTNKSTYYNGITATEGKQLAAALHDLITSTHATYTTYDDNGSGGKQKNTDRYYENGSAVSGYIYEFYSGVKWPDAWAPTDGSTKGGYNREHVWPQSSSKPTGSSTQMWGQTGGGADMHHLRPSENRLNSTRGNDKFGLVSSRESHKVYAQYGTNSTYALGGYDLGDVFEPLDSKKGDVARIVLYVYIHYNTYKETSLFGNYGTTNGNGSSSYFASSLLPLTRVVDASDESKALETLLSWNLSDPVDDIETRRNEQVAKYQGNRNPFIDNQEYACKIWGNTNDETKDICGLSEPSVKSVTVSPAAATIYLDKDTHKQLTATVSVTGGAPQTVNWTSSNNSVATVSSTGYVTALAEGSATITATSTFDGTKKGTCTITVKETGGTDPAVNSVTVTPSSYTMVLKDDTHKQLTATVDVEGDAPQTVTWSTSNSAVATVNASGVVTGKSAGTAVITATSTFDNTKKGTCTLTVENQEEDIVIDNEYVSSDVGSHFDLTVTSKDGGDITWTWDDYVEKFLSIPKNVTASGEILTIIVKGNGYAELTATETNGHSVVCYVVAGTGVMDPDEDPDTPIKPKQQSNATMPTWSWFAIGGGSALLIAGVVLLIIFLKKKPV